MNDDKPQKSPHTPDFSQQIAAKAARKIKARRNTQNVWFGLGMMGLVGWSIVLPMLLGATVGLWIDKHYTSSHSWSLVLLMAGLTFGCITAWHWVDKEDKAMHDEQEDDHE